METKGKAAREQRIKQEAEAKLALAKAPERMQKDLERRSNLPPKPLGDDYTFKPKIGKAVTAEMFKELHEKFAEDLMNKKSQMSLTKPQEPNISKSRPRPVHSEGVDEAEAALDRF
jgi:hypothetical protein